MGWVNVRSHQGKPDQESALEVTLKWSMASSKCKGGAKQSMREAEGDWTEGFTHHVATSLAMMAFLKAIVVAAGVARRLQVRG